MLSEVSYNPVMFFAMKSEVLSDAQWCQVMLSDVECCVHLCFTIIEKGHMIVQDW